MKKTFIILICLLGIHSHAFEVIGHKTFHKTSGYNYGSAQIRTSSLVAEPSYSNAVTVWNPLTQTSLGKFKVKGTTQKWTLSLDGNFLAVTDLDKNLLVWNVQTKKQLLKFKFPEKATNLGMQISPDNAYVAIAYGNHKLTSGYGLRVVSIAEQKMVMDKEVMIYDFTFDPTTSKLVYPKTFAAEHGLTLIVHDLKSGKTETRTYKNMFSVQNMTISPNGAYIVTGDSPSVFDFASGKQIFEWLATGQFAHALEYAFSPSARFLGFTGLLPSWLVDLSKGTIKGPLDNARTSRCFAFAEDESWFATGDVRGVSVWDLPTGSLKGFIEAPNSECLAMKIYGRDTIVRAVNSSLAVDIWNVTL